MPSDDPADGVEWIGRGTWLVDHRGHRPNIGVITDVSECDRGMGARLSIRWRSSIYQNTSVLLALENFKRGVWEVDHAE